MTDTQLNLDDGQPPSITDGASRSTAHRVLLSSLPGLIGLGLLYFAGWMLLGQDAAVDYSVRIKVAIPLLAVAVVALWIALRLLSKRVGESGDLLPAWCFFAAGLVAFWLAAQSFFGSTGEQVIYVGGNNVVVTVTPSTTQVEEGRRLGVLFGGFGLAASIAGLVARRRRIRVASQQKHSSPSPSP